ncbi:3'-5' exoribonuclease [Lachnospiraceae bacterium NK3A20]|jgi:3'-5' exoribonuclease|nr:3'-5' exoribonuclease [Lachnospiraceae bacterium NK3A20]
MKYIQDIKDGDTVNDIYLVKKKNSLTAKNGRPYESLTLQDRTGTIDAKIWEPGSVGIEDFGEMDYVDIIGEVTTYQKKLQLNIKRARRCKEDEYNPEDYVPVTKKNIKDMWNELIQLANTVKNPYLRKLIIAFFVEDQDFVKKFRKSSAAKTVHHGFLGGLLEHTLGVMKLCGYMADNYPFLNKDLLLSAALFHDIGKTRELSQFPQNDYTDEGQMIGHIVIGVEMIDEKIREIPDFPPLLANELRHCILAHHGELEFGSPKKPALAEAAALNFADNTDAKLEIFREMLEGNKDAEWLGWQSLLDSNIRRTVV